MGLFGKCHQPSTRQDRFHDRTPQAAHHPRLFQRSGTLLIPAFLTGASEAKASNFCSSYWKREFVKRTAIQKGLIPATNWLGISTDELRRVSTPRAQNWLLRFPLVYEQPHNRIGCEWIIREHGWPKAPKSSCWMCPNRRDAQWIHLRETRPMSFDRLSRSI